MPSRVIDAVMDQIKCTSPGVHLPGGRRMSVQENGFLAFSRLADVPRACEGAFLPS